MPWLPVEKEFILTVLRFKKARKAFFQLGTIHAFQGSQSLVSSSSIVQSCVLPILLYGVQNCVLSSESIKRLECFQGEVAKRILQLLQWYSNEVACIALGWSSSHSKCTIRKLDFLHRVLTNEESMCYRAYSVMVDDVETLTSRTWEQRAGREIATSTTSQCRF